MEGEITFWVDAGCPDTWIASVSEGLSGGRSSGPEDGMIGRLGMAVAYLRGYKISSPPLSYAMDERRRMGLVVGLANDDY